MTASTAVLGDGDGLFSFPLFPNKFHLLLLSFFPSSDDDGGDDAVRTRRRRRGEALLTAASAALFVLISSFPLIHLTFFSFHSSRAPTSLQFLSLIPVVVQPHSPALVHRSSDTSYFPACATTTTSSVKMVVPTARASTTTPVLRFGTSTPLSFQANRLQEKGQGYALSTAAATATTGPISRSGTSTCRKQGVPTAAAGTSHRV